MTSKAAEKIIEALTQLMEGYCELQEAVENDYGSAATTEDDEEGGELNAEADAALVTEMRAAVESVLESEDYTRDELGSIISTLTDALEEIDPDVFEKELEGEDDDDDDYDDEDAEDYDDEDYEDEDEAPKGGKKKRALDDDDEEYSEDEDEEDAPKRTRKK